MTGDEGSLGEHVPAAPTYVPFPPPEPEVVAPPRISRRSAVIRVVATLTLAGVLVGGLWAWLAPGVQAVVALTKSGDRVHGYIGDDSDHLFLAATLMVGFLTILALGAATAVWKWREHRGPEMVGALSIGLLLAAGAATGVGAGLAGLRYDTLDVAGAPVTPDHRVHYLTEAPGVFFGHSTWQIAATIVFPAGIAALAYAIGALSTSRDDLGAWPPAPAFGYAPVPTGPVPTAGAVPPDAPSAPSH